MPKIKQTIPEVPIENQWRDAHGLLKNLKYTYTEEGLIDWRALIPVKHLYLKNDPKSRAKIEEKYGKTYKEINILEDKVVDTDLVINLAGIRFLGKARGISEIKEIVNVSNPEYASVTSIINYLPIAESEMRPIVNSASASATLHNTTDFYQKYLVEAASNRAFCRNIRAVCNLSIVSYDELGKDNGNQPDDSLTINSQNPIDTHKIAAQKLKDAGFNKWKEFNNALLALGYEKWRDVEDFKTVDKADLMTIMGLAAGLQNGTLKPNKDKKE